MKDLLLLYETIYRNLTITMEKLEISYLKTKIKEIENKCKKLKEENKEIRERLEHEGKRPKRIRMTK